MFPGWFRIGVGFFCLWAVAMFCSVDDGGMRWIGRLAG